MQQGFWRDNRTWLLVGITLLVLVAGFLVKAQCLAFDWGEGREFEHYCYTDVQALYNSHVAPGQVPYVQGFNEYPPLTGLLMYVEGQLTPNIGAYFVLNSVVMALLAIGVTLMLTAMVGPSKRVLWWALAPSLAFYAFYNWDLVAVAFAIAGVWAYRKERFVLAGALLGFGSMAKLFPAFLMPGLGMALIAQRRRLDRDGWGFGLAFFAAVAIVALPLLLLNSSGLIESYRFQLARESNLETLWYALGHLGRLFQWDWLAAMGDKTGASIGSGLFLLASIVAAAILAGLRRLGALEAACIPLFAFLAFNKVFSIQYVLWALPFLVLLELPKLTRLSVLAADFFVWISIFTFFYVQEASNAYTAAFAPVVLGVLLRVAAFAWIAWRLLRQGLNPDAPIAPVKLAAS